MLRTKARFRVSSAMNLARSMPRAVLVRYSISSSMCCRYSLACGGILNLAKYMWADVRAQRFRRYQLNLSAKSFLQEKRQLHEVVKRFLTWLKLDEYVHITLLRLSPAGKRSKNAAAFYAVLA